MDDFQRIESLLKKIHRLEQENNSMLHKMHRAEVMKSVMGIVRLVVILGVVGAIYFFTRPLIQAFNETIGEVLEFSQKVQNVDVGSQVDVDTLKQKLGNTWQQAANRVPGLGAEVPVEAIETDSVE